MEKKIANAILTAILSVGKAEQKATKEANAAIAVLAQENIKDEQTLYQWALDSGNWHEKWPRPRSVWQEISRGKIESGKNCHWTINSQSITFDWKEEAEEKTKKVSLSLVAGLGRLCARLATAKSRAGENRTGKKKLGGNSLDKAALELAKKEAEKAQSALSTAKKEAEDAKKQLIVQKTAFESGLLKDKAVKAAKKQTDAALAALEESKAASAKVREDRDAKETMLLSIATAVNKAAIDSPKEELWAIIQEIKAALASNTSTYTRVKTPQPMP